MGSCRNVPHLWRDVGRGRACGIWASAIASSFRFAGTSAVRCPLRHCRSDATLSPPGQGACPCELPRHHRAAGALGRMITASGWLGLDWGNVPAWVGSLLTGTSLLVAALTFRRAVGEARRDQVSKVSAWLAD